MAWLIITLIAGIVGMVCVIGFLVSDGEDKVGWGAGTVILGIVWVILSVALSIHNVGQRQVGVQESFSGAITGVITKPGTTFVAPWKHVLDENIGIQKETFILDQANSAVSSDQQPIYANLTLNYNVEPQDVLKLFKTVGPNWKNILLDARVQQDFKEVTAGFSAEQITTQRSALRAQTKARLVIELGKYGIGVVDFFVTNLDYTQSYKDAISAKNVQVQQALQAQAKVAQSTAEAEQNVAQAKGQATANVALATGNAQAVLINARAAAEALRVKAAAIKAGGASILQLEAIDKLNPHASVIFCTGTGAGNCPSFLPSAVATGK